MSSAETVAEFVIERVRLFQPQKWQQARREKPLVEGAFSAPLALINEYSLFRVPDDACLGLLHWAKGLYQGRLWETVPGWEDILHAQAQGQRPVSMLKEVPPHLEAVAGIPKKYLNLDLSLAFALHDLRHLHKFFEPTHHLAQREFFQALHSTLKTPAWAQGTENASETFQKDIQRIASDMNGAAAFLAMALKAALRTELGDRAHAIWEGLPSGVTKWAFVTSPAE